MTAPVSIPRSRRLTVALLIAGLLNAVLAASSLAYPRPGRTFRATPTEEADAAVLGISMSDDGRYVVLASAATNLVPGDTNDTSDVFLLHRESRDLERLSVTRDGSESFGNAYEGDVSDDGRIVVFSSDAGDLVPGDDNSINDIFLRNRDAGTIERVTVSTGGGDPNSASWGGTLSADGRLVAFYSEASNLVSGDTNGQPDVFVRDLAARTTERVSVGVGGVQGTGDVWPIFDMTPDGRFVAFSSFSSNLVPGDTNGWHDVFVRDRLTGTTERVSVGTGGTQSVAGSLGLAISADGRFAAFDTTAANLVPADSNGANDVFVRDRLTGVTERVSVSGAGVEATGGSRHSYVVGMSADGRFVSFQSDATNLAPGDTNAARDIFVRDRLLGTTERVSLANDGSQPATESLGGNITLDGRWVLFSSAGGLVPGDTNGVEEPHLRDRGPSLGVGGLEAGPASGGTIAVTGWARFPGASWTATDPPNDGGPGATEAGGELVGTGVTFRAEEEDLLVRLDVSGLPAVRGGPVSLIPAVAGAPGVVYGMEFRIAGVRHEVRAFRVGATAVPPATPLFALYRCQPGCAEIARLPGAIGTTGDSVLMAVSLQTLGATEGSTLTGLRAFTALGEAAAGAVQQLDEAALPDVILPMRSVRLGVAPAGAAEEDVSFNSSAPLNGGDFAGTADVGGLPSGAHDVWARACLGESCASRRVTVALG